VVTHGLTSLIKKLQNPLRMSFSFNIIINILLFTKQSISAKIKTVKNISLAAYRRRVEYD
jgi:hypothetical protein